MAIKTEGPLPFLCLKTWGKEGSLGAERELGEPAEDKQTDRQMWPWLADCREEAMELSTLSELRLA